MITETISQHSLYKKGRSNTYLTK